MERSLRNARRLPRNTERSQRRARCSPGNAERSPKRAERTPACADHLLLRKIHIGGNAVNVRTALFDVCKVVVHAYRIRVLSVEVLSCCSGRRQCFRQIYRAISKGVVLIGFSIRLCSFEVHPER